MSDISETLKELLGDNAEEKINSVLGMLGGAAQNAEPPPAPRDEQSGLELTPELMAQAQGILGALTSGGGDDRSRLLMSLKPFMRETRQRSIDSAIKLISLAKLSHMFKGVL